MEVGGGGRRPVEGRGPGEAGPRHILHPLRKTLRVLFLTCTVIHGGKCAISIIWSEGLAYRFSWHFRP